MNEKAQGATAAKASGKTVTVICKIPQGMVLQLHKKLEVNEVTMGGSRTVTQFFPEEGKSIKINGPAHAQNEGPRVTMAPGGFAITQNVPEDFWERWMKETGQHLPAVKNGLIQALPNVAQAKDAATESRKTKTGLERLDPNNLPSPDARFQLKMAEEQVTKPVPEEE